MSESNTQPSPGADLQIPLPKLSLDVDLATEVQAAAAEMGGLTNPFAEQQTQVQAPPQTAYTPEEMKVITEFSEKIDITNNAMVLSYGSGAQKNIAAFSDTALNKVRTKDMGEVGDMLTNLVVELKGFNEDDDKGLFSFLKKGGNVIERLKAKYAKAEVNVDKIVQVLQKHQAILMTDVATFGKMYEMNMAYYKELGMYIEAGKMRLQKVRDEIIPAMRAKAESSKLTEDAQAVNDMENMALQFEKRIYDLELTRMVSIQMGPQIRLVQNNDSMMVDKINSSLVNTIPLWKSQMVIALGMENARRATQAQREVTDMTNKLLRQNADALKQGTAEVAKESERGIVDLQTLQYTNQQLIATIDEVLNIQSEGKKKRREAEVELVKIENDLRNKLTQARG